MSGNSWVTLATNDSYSLGALVLAHSLKRVGTAHSLTVLITPGVSVAMRNRLASVFNIVEEVNILDSKDEKNLALLTRPELGITFTKLHCWRLTQFSKCVFLDADVLVLQNCDELFDREELSAVPDVGWPDCFNSGVFVYHPSIDTYNALISFALSHGSFDGGDQGLLNQFFSDWATKDISRHLPFIYNMCSSATYSYLPAFKQYGDKVKIVHFIGSLKPWLQYLDTETRQVRPSSDSQYLHGFLQLWWDIFCDDVHSALSSDMERRSSQVTPLESSPMTHFNREIHSNLQPEVSPYEFPNVDVKLEPSDGYWDPWENYQDHLGEIPSGELGTHSSHTETFHERIGYEMCQTETNFEQYHECQCNSVSYLQEIHNNSLVPVNDESENTANIQSQSQNLDTFTDTLGQPRNDQNTLNCFVGPHECTIFEPHSECTGNEGIKEKHADYKCEFPSSQQLITSNCQPEVCVGETNFTLSSQSPPDTARQRHNSEALHAVQNVEHNKKCYEWSQSANMNTTSKEHENTPPVLPSLCNDSCLPKSSDNSTSYETECFSSPATTELMNEDAGLAGAMSQLTLGVPRSPEQNALEEHLRKQAWEQGNIDYMGRDSFDNIWRKICQTLAESPTDVEETQPSAN